MWLVNNVSASDAEQMERRNFVYRGAALTRKLNVRPNRWLVVISYCAAAIFGLVFWGFIFSLSL